MTTTRKRQRWFCDRCDVGAVVSFDAVESVRDVADRIGVSHAALSPACDAEHGIAHVRAPQAAR